MDRLVKGWIVLLSGGAIGATAYYYENVSIMIMSLVMSGAFYGRQLTLREFEKSK